MKGTEVISFPLRTRRVREVILARDEMALVNWFPLNSKVLSTLMEDIKEINVPGKSLKHRIKIVDNVLLWGSFQVWFLGLFRASRKPGKFARLVGCSLRLWSRVHNLGGILSKHWDSRSFQWGDKKQFQSKHSEKRFESRCTQYVVQGCSVTAFLSRA